MQTEKTVRDHRKPWQKLRWWVLAWLLVMAGLMALGVELKGGCRDINYLSGGCW